MFAGLVADVADGTTLECRQVWYRLHGVFAQQRLQDREGVPPKARHGPATGKADLLALSLEDKEGIGGHIGIMCVRS